jgi:hypothetical protein
MENDNWVEQRMAALEPPPDWQPDTAAAIRRHHGRRQEAWRRGPGLWWKLAMAAAVVLAVALIPPARGLAQHLWRLLKVGRVEVVRLDLDLLPKESSLRAEMILKPEKMVKAETAEAAGRLAGFVPRLPRRGVLTGDTKLSVMGPVAFGITLKAEDLRQLLRRAGIDEPVPPSWDGARIVMHTAGTVMAEWPEIDTMLMQAPPLTMAAPDGFDLRAFTTLFLRGLRMSRDQAERLGVRMSAAPAWMMAIEPDEKVGIREVMLRSGPGTLVYDYDEDHPDRVERLTLIWSVPDRVFILSTGLGDTVAIAAANAIE